MIFMTTNLQIETYSFALSSNLRLCETPEILSPTEVRTVLMEKISFVIPVYNEESNLDQLIKELSQVADGLGHDYEILFVDDGSNDRSLDTIKKLADLNNRVRYLALACNSGQSAALYAGFQQASGDVVITLDADLQNDPADIPKLLQFYGEYDMVNGWRANRQDTAWKKFGSRIGNFVRNRLTWEAISDTGCSLKVMRADMLKRIRMYRGLHRFLPTMMRLEGARLIEVPVNHRPRLRGVSKYGNLKRGLEGLYDVMVVRWMIRSRLKIEIRERHV
jgi:dolichol-phosphate mannosyltransferase